VLVGRQEELAQIGSLLQPQAECRLLTLVGPGGIGKTRLAIEAAGTVDPSNGVWFVPLAPMDAGTSVASAIVDVLGLRLDGAADAGQQLLAYLRRREMLLILDNFEHLLSPLNAPAEAKRTDASTLLTKLLEQAPSVKLLVTSRQRINLSAEWVFDVGGLQFPPMSEGMAVDELTSFSAVQLFLQRARQLKRSVGRDPDELAIITRICQLVGGMPLALELAAAWVKVLSSREILQEIERSLSFLQTNRRDYPERHRNMRAVFDTSWKMLSAPERQLFRRLSVFRGGFTRAAAEAVSGERAWTEEELALQPDETVQLDQRQPQVLAALAGLVDKSFVRHSPAGRYEIHELMRQYGAAKLLERVAEERAARDDHARYYQAFIDRHTTGLKGRRQREVLKLVSQDIENLKTAWNWSVSRGRLDWLAQMLTGLMWLMEIRNDFQEAAVVTEKAVRAFRARDAPAALTDPAERDSFAYLLGRAGWMLFRSGQTERGRALSNEALELLRPESDPEYLWTITVERSYVELAVGNLEDASAFAERAQRHAEALDSAWHLGFPIALLGIVALQEGDPMLAAERLQESLALWLEVGDPRGLLFTYTNLGLATLALGQSDEALAYAGECLALSVEIDDRWSQANALNLAGQVQVARGEHEAAKANFRESAELHQEVGDLRGTAEALVSLGNAALAADEGEQAEGVFQEALSVAEQARAVATGLKALVGLAKIEVEREPADWAYSLATYVAAHSQADEYTRDAARQICEELQGYTSEPESEEVEKRFRGRRFTEVVGIVRKAAGRWPADFH
jgi:predicted ATPase